MERYIDTQKEHISAAYTGTMGTTHSAKIMATIGLKGTGTIKHHSIEHKQHTIAATVYFDIGMRTKAVGSARNDSTITLQTSTRIYLVSQHRAEGAPLSMAEARVVSPITPTCTTLVHMQQGMYRVVQGGLLTCTGRTGKSTKDMQTGQNVHIDERDTCNTTCLEIGHSSFTDMHKHMPEQPTVHHDKMLTGILAPKDRKDTPHVVIGGGGGQMHSTEHNMLGKNIREAQDMLEDLQQAITKPDMGDHLGLLGLICSLSFALLLLAILVRWRWCKPRGPPRAQHPDIPLVEVGNNNDSYE